MLSSDLIDAVERLSAIGRDARVLATTGSTNDDARAWASEGAPSGAVVIADAQDAGRGRHGRRWSTPQGSTLALSTIARPELPPARLPTLSIVIGLAVRRAIAARLTSRQVAIKWPNDVWVDGKKIAGILVEATWVGPRVDALVIGIGINVARREFPPELVETATSLALAGARDSALDRTALAIDLLEAIDEELDAHGTAPDALPDKLAPHDALAGRRVRLIEPGTIGIADGIDENGRLRVRCDDGALHFAHAGEVTLEPAR